VKKRTAKEVMIREVMVVQAEWSVDRLAEFLIENGISGAPVTSEEGTLIGVVSLTDIVRYGRMPEKEPRAHGPHAYYRNGLEGDYSREDLSAIRIDEETSVLVRDIMTPMIFNVEADTPLSKVADTMITGRIHRLLVTEGRKVVGMITALDLLKEVRD